MATTLKTIMKLDSGEWKKGLKSVNEALDAYAVNVKISANSAKAELKKLYRTQDEVSDKLSKKNEVINKQKEDLAKAISNGDKALEKSTRKKLKALAIEKSIIATQLQEARKSTAEQIRLNAQRVNSENRVTSAYDIQRERFEDGRRDREQFARQYENNAEQRYKRELRRLVSLRREGIISRTEQIEAFWQLQEARDRDIERTDRQTQSTESLANQTIRYLRWAGTIAGVVYAVSRAYKSTLGIGMNVNSMMESQTNGIAALISANTQMTDSLGNSLSPIEKFTLGQRYAKKAMAELRKEALKTPASFSELSAVYQQAIGQTLSMGKSFGKTVDDISLNTIKFASRMTNISGSIGQEIDKTKEEIRSLVTGSVTTDSIIGTMLFGTPTEANARIKEAKKTAGGFKKLMDEMLEPFDVLANTRTYQKGILAFKDSWEKAMGDMVAKSGMFADITDAFYDMSASIIENTDSMVDSFDTFYSGVKTIGGVLDNILVPAAGVASVYALSTATLALSGSVTALTRTAMANPIIAGMTVASVGAYSLYEYFDDISDAFNYGSKILKEKSDDFAKLNISELKKRQKALNEQLKISKEYNLSDLLTGVSYSDKKDDNSKRNEDIKERLKLIDAELKKKKEILGIMDKTKAKLEEQKNLELKLSLNTNVQDIVKDVLKKDDTKTEAIIKKRVEVQKELNRLIGIAEDNSIKDTATWKKLNSEILRYIETIDSLNKQEEELNKKDSDKKAKAKEKALNKELKLRESILLYEEKKSQYTENLLLLGEEDNNITSEKIKLRQISVDINSKENTVNKESIKDIKAEIRLIDEKNKFVLGAIKEEEKGRKEDFDIEVSRIKETTEKTISGIKDITREKKLSLKLEEEKAIMLLIKNKDSKEAARQRVKIESAQSRLNNESSKKRIRELSNIEKLERKIEDIASVKSASEKEGIEFLKSRIEKEKLSLSLLEDEILLKDGIEVKNKDYEEYLKTKLLLETDIAKQKKLQDKEISQIVDPFKSGLSNALVSGIQDAINSDFDLTNFTKSITSSIGSGLINSGVMNGNMAALGLGIGVTAVGAMIGDGGKTAEEIEADSDKRIQEQTDKIVNALDAQTSVFKSFGLESKVVKNEIEAERARLISVAKDQASGSKTTSRSKLGGLYSSKTTSTINLSSLVNSISDIEKYYDTIKQKQDAGYKGMDIDALNIAIDEFASSSVDLVGTYEDLSTTFKDIYTSLGETKYEAEELADAKIDIGFTNINAFKSNLDGMIKYLDDYGTSVSELESDLTGEDYKTKLEALNTLYKATGVNFLDSSENMGEAVNNALDSIDSYSIVGAKLAEIASEKKDLDDEYLRIGKSELELREIDIKLLDESNQALQRRNWALEDEAKLNAIISDLDFDLLFVGLPDSLKTTAERAKVLAEIKDEESKQLQQEIYDKQDALKVAQDLIDKETELNKINFDLGKERLDLIYEIKKVGMNDAQKLEFDRKVELSQIYDETSKQLQQEIYDKEDLLSSMELLNDRELEITEEKISLSDELNRLGKSETELREIDILNIDESNRALQRSIWAREDEIESLENTSKALEKEIENKMSLLELEKKASDETKKVSLSQSKNLADWILRNETAEEKAKRLSDAIGVDVSNSFGELSLLSSSLAGENGKLTDTQLEVLRANDELVKSNNDLIKSANEASIALKSGFIQSLDGMIESLAQGDSSSSLDKFNTSIKELMNGATDANKELLLQTASANIGSLSDTENFTSKASMLFAQSIAKNQLTSIKDIEEVQLTQLEVTQKLIEEMQTYSAKLTENMEATAILNKDNQINALLIGGYQLNLGADASTTADELKDALSAEFNWNKDDIPDALKTVADDGTFTVSYDLDEDAKADLILKFDSDSVLQTIATNTGESLTEEQLKNAGLAEDSSLSESGESSLATYFKQLIEINNIQLEKETRAFTSSSYGIGYTLGSQEYSDFAKASGTADMDVYSFINTLESLGTNKEDFDLLISKLNVDKDTYTFDNESKYAKAISGLYSSGYLSKDVSETYSNIFNSAGRKESINLEIETYKDMLSEYINNISYLNKKYPSINITPDIGTTSPLLAKISELESTSVTGYYQGGYTGNGKETDIAGVVHNREYVVDASTTKDLGLNGNGGFFKDMATELKELKEENKKMAIILNRILYSNSEQLRVQKDLRDLSDETLNDTKLAS